MHLRTHAVVTDITIVVLIWVNEAMLKAEDKLVQLKAKLLGTSSTDSSHSFKLTNLNTPLLLCTTSSPAKDRD